jgi:hypothetical protein
MKKDFHLEKAVLTLPEVVVTGEKVTKNEVSRVALSRDEMATVPGTAGDVLRSLQTLPGVNGSGDYSDALLVRGGGVLDNLFLLDGIPLIFPYHFAGLLSTLNSNLIQSVDFSAGGFGPGYGGYYGGLIDLTQRSPRSDRWGGNVEVTPILSGGGVEGPVGQDGSFSLSGRRSYLEVFSPLLTGFNPVPSFYDYQAKYSLKLSPRVQADFEAFGSGDAMGLSLQNGFSVVPGTGGVLDFLDYNNGFDSQGIRIRYSGEDGNTLTDTAYHTTFSMGVSTHETYLNLHSEDFGNRFDWLHVIGPGAQLEAGWQYDHSTTSSAIKMGLLPAQDDLDPFNFLFEYSHIGSGTAGSDNLSLYFNQKFQSRNQKLDFAIGGRLDYESYNHDADPSPRLSLAYQFSDDTVLKASYGFYSQQPFFGLYSVRGFGNPQLTSEWSSTAVLGLEQKLGGDFLARLEGYNKDLSRLMEIDPNVNYSNSGSGNSRGVELFLRVLPGGPFMGWVSYALCDSERRDGPQAPLHPYIYDQPNVVTAVASYRITSAWDAGFKIHYATGSPYTPIIGNRNIEEGYAPLYGPENSARLPDYFRVDFSTSLRTVYDTWQWRVFLEVWNLTDQQNIETYAYNSDYTQYQPVYEFPLLPYLGLEAGF